MGDVGLLHKSNQATAPCTDISFCFFTVYLAGGTSLLSHMLKYKVAKSRAYARLINVIHFLSLSGQIFAALLDVAQLAVQELLQIAQHAIGVLSSLACGVCCLCACG